MENGIGKKGRKEGKVRGREEGRREGEERKGKEIRLVATLYTPA